MTVLSTPVSESRVLVHPDVTEDEEVVEIVRRWHDDTHDGGFKVCSEQPCHAIAWAGWV